MKIIFRFAWLRNGVPWRRGFKSPGCYEQFYAYRERISRFATCRVAGGVSSEARKSSVSKLWLCDRAYGSKGLSSEEVAQKLEHIRDLGSTELYIGIGGPDGFSRGEITRMKPDLLWSFGPLTLPHELAAVVAAEQIYRAWTILHGMPYHSGH